MPDDKKPTNTAAGTFLLVVTALVVVAGVVVLGVLAYLSHHFQWQGFWKGAGQPYATTIVGLAAFTAGAIAFHNNRSQLAESRADRETDQEQWDEKWKREKEQWDDQRAREQTKDLRARFSEATTQLADANATIRRSGAYAMAALANDWRAEQNDAEMMVCFGVLANYVTDENATYALVESKHTAGADGPVRATIVALLSQNAQHFVPEKRPSRGPAPTNLLHGADLRGVVFSTPVGGVSLRAADLTGADFSRATDLAKADFRGAKLIDANLYMATLDGADLTGAMLSGADISLATFAGANLRVASLTETTRLDYANFKGANLSSTFGLNEVDLSTVKHDEHTKWPKDFQPPPNRR